MKDYILGVINMRNEKVKKFWNKHKNTVKKAVVLIVVPIPVIALYVVCDKMIKSNRPNELLDMNIE
jgi:hypothetical protein